jgi:hypothetical protein
VKLGNTLVVLVASGGASVVPTITDSLNLQWLTINNQASGLVGGIITAFYAIVTVSGTPTVTVTATSTDLAMALYEIEGTGSFDPVASTLGSGSPAASISILCPVSQPNELGFMAVITAATGTISAATPSAPQSSVFDTGNIVVGGATGLKNFGVFSAELGYPINTALTGSQQSLTGNNINTFKATLGASVGFAAFTFAFRPAVMQVNASGSIVQSVYPNVNVADGGSVKAIVDVAGNNASLTAGVVLFNGNTWDRARSAQLPTTIYTTNVAQTNLGVSSVGILSGPAGSAVQNKNTATAGAVASIAAAMTNPPSKGNSIVVVCAVGNASTPTIADTIATSYKLVSSQLGPSSAFGVYIFYGIVPASSGNTVTVTNGGSAASMGIEVYEINGLLAIPAQQPDQTAIGVNTGTAAATPALNPQYANEICFAGVGVGTTAETITPAAGWINDSTTQTGTSGLFSFASLSQFVPDFQSVIPAATIGASKPWAMAAVSFRPIALGVADQNNTCVDLVTGDAQTLNVAQTYNGVTQINRHNRGAIITVEIGTVSGTSPTLTLQLQWSPDNGATWLNFGGPITGLTTLISNTTGAFVVYPSLLTGLTTGATLTTLVAAPLPRTWRITYTVGGTGTPTFPITSFVNYAL